MRYLKNREINPKKKKSRKPKRSNKKDAIFLKDGEVVETPKRKYLTWEPDRRIWEEKIENRKKGYAAYREFFLH